MKVCAAVFVISKSSVGEKMHHDIILNEYQGDGKNNQLLDASSSEMNNTFLFFMQPSRLTGKPIVMWATELNNQEASGCIKDCS